MNTDCKIIPLDFLDSDDEVDPNKIYKKVHPMMPSKRFRWCVVGSSGSGKTLMVCNLVMRGFLDFERICIFAPSIQDNPDYIRIIKILQNQAEKENIPLSSLLVTGEEVKDIPKLEELENRKTICIFDDLLTERNQDIIKTYFTRGRHKGISSFYLAQGYFDIPKLIRRNCNVVSLFSLDGREVNELSRNIEISDKNKLLNMYKEATNEPYGFLHVDLTQQPKWCKYRKNLDGFFKELIPDNLINVVQ